MSEWIFECNLIDLERNEVNRILNSCKVNDKNSPRQIKRLLSWLIRRSTEDNNVYLALLELIFSVFARCRNITTLDPQLLELESDRIEQLEEWSLINDDYSKRFCNKYKPLLVRHQPKSLASIILRYIKYNLDKYEFNLRILSNDIIYKLIKL